MNDTPPEVPKIRIPSLLDDTSHKACVPMTREQTELFINLTIMETEQGPKPYDGDWAKRAGTHGMILYDYFRRLRFQGCGPVSVAVGMFLACLSRSPGIVVMYAHTLTQLSKEKSGAILTLEDLANAFPVGFPTEETLKKVWHGQKGYAFGMKDVDNLIDHPNLLEY